jgi:hypothetical protein
LISTIARADMDELFRAKSAIAAQRQAAQSAAEDESYAREIAIDLTAIMHKFASEHRGLAMNPRYEFHPYGETPFLDKISFLTQDGYECEARRMDADSTFNAEARRHLVCINNQTLNAISLIKVGSSWQTGGNASEAAVLKVCNNREGCLCPSHEAIPWNATCSGGLSIIYPVCRHVGMFVTCD